MNYIGIQAQQSRNNIKTVLLLLMFPALILALTYAFLYLTSNDQEMPYESTTDRFIQIAPLIMTGIAVWFLIAYLFNTYIINSATNSHPLERRDNKRIYNLVENLCMANGMDMPKINVIEDDSLNAFASGINKKSYTVTLTRGIINRLNDEELEGVIAHELTHIRNKDVRLLIISIVFVGIFTFISQMASRMAYYNSWSSNKDKNGGNGAGNYDAHNCVACLDRLFLLIVIAVCHLTQARVYGRRRSSTNDQESGGPRFGSEENIGKLYRYLP